MLLNLSEALEVSGQQVVEMVPINTGSFMMMQDISMNLEDRRWVTAGRSGSRLLLVTQKYRSMCHNLPERTSL